MERLDVLLKALGDFKAAGETEGIIVTNLTHDSRTVQQGSLFICIDGTKADGHLYAAEAQAKGACAVVAQRELELNIPQIIVPDSRKVMSLLAAEFYGRPAEKLKLIGVTGTNGKTTTTYMIRCIAEGIGKRCGVIGTTGIFAGQMPLELKSSPPTTPDPIELQYILAEMLKLNMDWVVMEVSAHALDLKKTEGMVFDSAVFTNLTQDHLDYFGDMDSYFEAKLKLFNRDTSRMGAANTDDSFGLKIYELSEVPVLTYGLKNRADLTARDIVCKISGSSFTLYHSNQSFQIKLPVPAEYNVYNALSAISAAVNLGVPLKEAAKPLEGFKSVPGRFNVIEMPQGFAAVVDYAHSPDGLDNLLRAVRGSADNRVITVFGCGGDRDKLKRPIMGKIAGELSDFCIITSDNPRNEEPMSIIEQIAQGVIETGIDHVKIENRTKAIEYACTMAQKGDIIVIAGKGDEPYQEISGVKYPYNDMDVLIGIKNSAKQRDER